MKILVINCGSSSIKYRLFEIDNSGRHEELAKGLVERVGSDDAKVTHQFNSEKVSAVKPIRDYKTGIADISEQLHSHHLINGDLAGIGHRVLHAAEAYQESVIIDSDVIREIDRCSELGPLHNPANLAGIKACKEIFPDLPQMAVFRYRFFQTLAPEPSFMLPIAMAMKFVFRYGFPRHKPSFHHSAAAAYLKNLKTR